MKYNKDKSQALIEIEIKEPWRWEFYFSGNLNQSTADIYSALDLTNRERKNLDPASEGAERLRRSYLAKGFPNIQIETRIDNPKDTYLKRVYYKIEEGPKVRIARIDVQGRISRPSSYYEKFILQNSSRLVAKGFYNRSDLENGFRNLVTDLRNQGFLRAKVLSTRVEFNEKRDKVTVHLLLEEGPQTQIRALDFEGNKYFSSFELSEVTGLKTNTPLKLQDFEESIDKLNSFYRNQGFLEMKLLNEGEDLIQYNETGSQARIVFRLYEGPRIRISSIVVEGNTFTKARVILMETDFKVGEVLTPAKIDDATVRLNKLGLFSRADIRTLEEGTNIGERTLIITVAERDPGVFRFGAGVNNERKLTLRGFTGLSYNNLYGTARGISGRVEVKSNVAQINYLENEVSAGYLEPFIFRSRTRGRAVLTRSEHVFDYQSDSNVTKILESNRIDLLAERDLTQHTKFTWKIWSMDRRRERERHGYCISDEDGSVDVNNQCKDSTQQVALIGPALDIDYRDNPFLPTKGSLTRLAVDYSNPEFGSTDKPRIEFVKVDGTYSQYIRLGSPNVVWANSARAGYISNLSDKPDSGVPTSYAFFLGGIYSVRGFDIASDNNRIPKQDDDGLKVKKQTQILFNKDSNYFLIKSELRFPLYQEHGGVIFYDGGAVRISGYRFRDTYRDAIGFGYRYNTPVGPVALDLAFKLDPQPGEDKFRFHLSIGTF
jgi:outer membrane protein assembly complex protein YaeT